MHRRVSADGNELGIGRDLGGWFKGMALFPHSFVSPLRVLGRLEMSLWCFLILGPILPFHTPCSLLPPMPVTIATAFYAIQATDDAACLLTRMFSHAAMPCYLPKVNWQKTEWTQFFQCACSANDGDASPSFGDSRYWSIMTGHVNDGFCQCCCPFLTSGAIHHRLPFGRNERHGSYAADASQQVLVRTLRVWSLRPPEVRWGALLNGSRSPLPNPIRAS